MKIIIRLVSLILCLLLMIPYLILLMIASIEWFFIGTIMIFNYLFNEDNIFHKIINKLMDKIDI